jgi:hypothetical protein
MGYSELSENQNRSGIVAGGHNDFASGPGRLTTVPKRPRFSRWRRLPGVFRTGDNRPATSGTELDRIILYVPARILDLAEALAEKAGVPTVQDYCALLLMQSLEKERVDHKVADFEARRGPLEGLKQIAADPDYLAEWQESSDAKPDGAPQSGPNHDATGQIALVRNESTPVDIVYSEVEVRRLESRRDSILRPEHGRESDDERQSIPNEPDAGMIPTVSLKPMVLKMSDSLAADVISRHAGSGEDQWGFLPCLRRGEPVPGSKSAELIYALNQLEEELRGFDSIDRRTAHALHRLALESQVLLTDAWAGVFDDRVITVIRTVQEAVERILSGQDIRYYPAPQASASERSR